MIRPKERVFSVDRDADGFSGEVEGWRAGLGTA